MPKIIKNIMSPDLIRALLLKKTKNLSSISYNIINTIFMLKLVWLGDIFMKKLFVTVFLLFGTLFPAFSADDNKTVLRSEEHTSELQSR